VRNSSAAIAIVLAAVIAGGGVYGVLATSRNVSTTTFTSVSTSTVTATTSKASGITSPIKIGVLEPLSGALAAPGLGIVHAIQLAALQINQSGGINGQPIKLIVDDVQTDPQTALNDLQNLYSVQGVQVVIGPPTSQQVLTLAQYATQNHILVVTSSATAGKLTGLSPYIFRTAPSDNLQALAVAAYVNAKGYQHIGIVTRNDAFGQGLASSIQSLLGGKVVVTILVTSGQTDYTTQMTQVKAANPDAIFYDEFTADGILMFKNAQNLGMQNIPTIGSIELQDPSFFKDQIAASYMARTNLTGPSVVSSANTAPYVEFANAFQQKFGSAPGVFTSQTYDAAMLVFAAIARAGTYNATAIAAQLVSVSTHYVGPSGYLEMNGQGDITQVSYTFFRVVQLNATSYGFTTFGSFSPATGIKLSG